MIDDKAFADEGYVKAENSKIFQSLQIVDNGLVLDGKELMTGSEWYERFEEELLNGTSRMLYQIITDNKLVF